MNEDFHGALGKRLATKFPDWFRYGAVASNVNILTCKSEGSWANMSDKAFLDVCFEIAEQNGWLLTVNNKTSTLNAGAVLFVDASFVTHQHDNRAIAAALTLLEAGQKQKEAIK